MRALALALIVAFLAAGCAAPASSPTPKPPRLVAIGDSLTAAANLDASRLGEQPAHSWAAGDDPADGVTSHYERLRAQDANWTALNVARSGARMTEFARQAQEAIAANATYVVVLLGGNDACSRQGITPPDTFRAQFRLGADLLKAAGIEVFVVSIPDVGKLYDAMRNESIVRARWSQMRVCPALLSENATDAQRDAVLRAIDAYDAILAQESAAYGFATDGGAAHDAPVALGDVSDLDYFHPSLAGQARLAETTWAASPRAHR